jgi:fructose-bisphosphate aldolase, class II
MARITLRQLLDHTAEHFNSVPAFNINNMEQALAIQHGFTSVMMDGSLKEEAKTSADYDYNVKITGQVAELAHLVGVSVEGEPRCLGSLESGHGEAEDGHGFEGKLDRSMLLTDPQEAARFVAETKVDALVVAIGTSHGAYKFTRKPPGDVLAMDVIEKIYALIPNTHIVMHGSSSVPEELQDVFNKHGGAMKETYGGPCRQSQSHAGECNSQALRQGPARSIHHHRQGGINQFHERTRP